jgi:hypothetical protein
MSKQTKEMEILEFRAELLKERIYATFVLLAVLLTIDVTHTTPFRAVVVLGGATLSLWAASLVASRMSYRIVMKRIESDRKLNLRLAQHRPLIYAALFPVFMATLALIHVISLVLAMDIAVGGLVLLLVTWSLLSAKAIKAGRFATIVLASVELLIGLMVIGLKLIASH